jgi:hypothetical protein
MDASMYEKGQGKAKAWKGWERRFPPPILKIRMFE